MPKIDKREAFKALQNPDTYATVLLMLSLVAAGKDVNLFELDSIAIYVLLKDEYGTEPCQACKDKLQALITAMTGEDFFHDLETFSIISNTLLDGDPEFYEGQPPTLFEALWAIYEVKLNMDYEPHFTQNIKKYIDELADNERIDLSEENTVTNPSLNESGIIMEFLRENYLTMLGQIKALGINVTPKAPSINLLA